MAQPKYIPKKGVFESTLACNLRCKHCGSRAGVPREDELTTAECVVMFRQLKELGMEWLTISGGEPMARPDWLELIASAAASGLRVGMITNAISLDEGAIAAAKAAGLSGVGLSVDGLSETHDRVRGRKGHFDRLMTVMDNCRAASLPFSAVTHINRDNYDELEALAELLADRGAYAWQVQPGSKMGNMKDNAYLLMTPGMLPGLEKRLAKMIHSRKPSMGIYPADSMGYFGPHEKALRSAFGGHCFGGCSAGIRNIGIESNGNIKGCLSIMAGYNEEGANYVEGNIRETPLAEIWNRPGAFAYTRNWSRRDLSGFCGSCSFADKCKGGCIGKRISDGDISDNRMCVYRVRVESGAENRLGAVAAAVVLAGLMGTATACDSVDDPAPRDTAADTSTDTVTDTTADSNTDDTTSVDLYGIMPSTDSETSSDTGVDTAVAEYGIPETDSMAVDYYGIIPTDTDTVTDTSRDTDTFGIPIYSMLPAPEN